MLRAVPPMVWSALKLMAEKARSMENAIPQIPVRKSEITMIS